jgi:peptidoglycan hydrolase CwlO-like protein
MKKQITAALMGVLIFALVLFLANNNTRLQSQISVLEGKNQMLEELNKGLEKQNEQIEDSIAKIENSLNDLKEKEQRLAKENVELENNIKKLNKKYEKASNHAANYNADSIKRYFTELK